MRDPLPPTESAPLRLEPVRVLGVGSPFGDDRAGWVVVETLRERLPEGRVEVQTLDRPGPALLHALAGRRAAILIDAVADGSEAGRVLELSAAELRADPALSSHAFGLAEALALGRALGILPAELTLYLVSIDPARARMPNAPLSTAVAAAAARLADQLVRALGDRPAAAGAP